MTSIGITEEVVLTLCEDLDSARSLSVAILLRYREYSQLCNLRTEPHHYLTADDYFKSTVPTDFLRKCRGLSDPSPDAAFTSWLASEHECKRTNDRLSKYIHNGPFSDPGEIRIANFFDDVKNLIELILGPVPSSCDFSFGNGATFYDKSVASTVPDKIQNHAAFSCQSWPLLSTWASTAWGRYRFHDPICVRGNRYATVPKDSVKDRSIGIEPSINVSAQLPLGTHIRNRLKRFGIDLITGQAKHRNRAQSSSTDNSWATIDLSSASDTIARNLVQLLLPNDWFELLSICRSPFTNCGTETDECQKWYFLEKFSSMGNGYTFELETLLFLALSVTALRHSNIPSTDVLVYGDDIIVPSAGSRAVVSVLRFCGFTLNRQKTFSDGPFRESCGGDFFNGTPVRGFFLKEIPSEPQHYIKLANSIWAMGHSDSSCYWSDSRFRRAWYSALSALPTNIRRLRGPSSLGDVVIHDSPSNYSYNRRMIKDHPWCYEYRCLVPTPTRLSLYKSIDGVRVWKDPVIYTAALFGIGSDTITPRGSIEGYSIKWLQH